jgi:hypothetical protein
MRNSILLVTLGLLCGLFGSAQSIADGLSLNGASTTTGTARFRALSGAFGALGGDLSAMGINPAGSAVFANHYASFTVDLSVLNNDTTYENTLSESNDTDFSLNQAGIALVFGSANNNQSINKFALGFNYDSSRNYDDNVLIQGTSGSSISSYYLNNANGIELDNFQLRRGESISDLYQFLGEEPGLGFGAQQGFLGFQSLIIDPIDISDPNNISYFSNTGTGAFNQSYREVNEGYQGKFTFNGALEINNRVSLGVNVNTHVVNRERRTSFREQNNNSDALVTDVRLENVLTTEAAGISFQFGSLIKITPELRLGLAYESPTWFTVDESLTQAVSTFGNTPNGLVDELIAPDVINVYEPYRMRTPGGFSGSLAYVFGDKGLISMDVSTKDYRNLRFSPADNILFVSNNRFADQSLQQAFTYRLGTEIRIKKAFVRGGVIRAETPYADKSFMTDLEGFSLGFGYRWGNTVLDLAYSRSSQDYSKELFSGDDLSAGMVNQTLNNVIVTLGFNL